MTPEPKSTFNDKHFLHGTVICVMSEPKKRLADELLTMEDVAEILRVPVATLRKWRAEGTGPAGFRLGKYVRYKMSSVEQFIAEQENKEER